ncbi:MAG: putative toxin-antitoxin system toxin component, PIN family [Chloroflexi bacterium]|nr:putative toxin-antitoxin system toxin component, PIN family [Chloroflexota bacterium]
MKVRKGKPRAVVDTNILLSAIISKGGRPYQLLEGWRRGEFVLVTCRTLLKEVEDVLQRPHIKEKYGLTSEAIRDLLRLLKDETERVRIARKLPLAIRDPKDEKVLACVLGGQSILNWALNERSRT